MKKTLLLVLDLINELIHPEGKSGAKFAEQCEKHQVIKHTNEAIALARKHNIPVAHVRVGFSKNYAECPKGSPIFGKAAEYQAFQLDTWGTEFHEYVDVQPEDFIITKHRVSPFYNTQLEPFLRAQKFERIVVCGVSTQNAVLSTVKEGHDRDYEMIVLANACSSHDEKTHEAMLEVMKALAQVLDVEGLASIL